MPRARLALTRAQILAGRRSVLALDQRLPAGRRALRQAAWAGLQDSVPRAALLSIHARVDGTTSSTWDAPSLVQLWGPRYSAYVVAARDAAVFSLGRMPDAGPTRRTAEQLADRLERFLAGRSMSYADAGRALGVAPNRLRYATLTGRLLMRWEGAHRPTIRTTPPPALSLADARLELARRYLHVFGPTTADAFAVWAGISPRVAGATFVALSAALLPVRTPLGDAVALASDEPTFRGHATAAAPARLLPSGDAYYLLQGTDRTLLVERDVHRRALWTSRVWPGALLVDGEIAGTWRRARGTVSVSAWRRLAPAEREAVEIEAASLPLPGLDGAVTTQWTR